MKQGNFPHAINYFAVSVLVFAPKRMLLTESPSSALPNIDRCAHRIGIASLRCLQCWQASCHSVPFISSFTIFSPGPSVWYLLVGLWFTSLTYNHMHDHIVQHVGSQDVHSLRYPRPGVRDAATRHVFHHHRFHVLPTDP